MYETTSLKVREAREGADRSSIGNECSLKNYSLKKIYNCCSVVDKVASDELLL